MNKNILKNQQGVALLMVLTSITILTALLAEFTFETKINKIKSYNLQDKLQAKLNAEAGIQLAMARMRLYKESFNYLEKNKDAKNFVNQKTLNQIWDVPFVYPIPVSDKMGAREKAAIEKFTKETLLIGELAVTIKNISNLININMLRAPLVQKTESENSSEDSQKSEEQQQFTADFQILELLKNGLQKKREEDEIFEDKYASLEPKYLVSSIKYFISERDSYDDENTPQLLSEYSSKNTSLKYTPFSSDSELHLLAGWDDEIVELIEGEITTHGSVMIDLNKINSNMLKVLLPDISEEQVKAFFEYRDDPENPHYFNTLKDFQTYVTGEGQIMSDETFEERFNNLKKNGLKFGPAPTLFEIKSAGVYNRASYTLTAIVSIPAEPELSQAQIDEANQAKKNNQNQTENESQTTTENESQTTTENESQTTTENETNTEEEKPIVLMEPRIQEIYTE